MGLIGNDRLEIWPKNIITEQNNCQNKGCSSSIHAFLIKKNREFHPSFACQELDDEQGWQSFKAWASIWMNTVSIKWAEIFIMLSVGLVGLNQMSLSAAYMDLDHTVFFIFRYTSSNYASPYNKIVLHRKCVKYKQWCVCHHLCRLANKIPSPW